MKTKILIVAILFANIVSAQWTRITNSPTQATSIYFYSASTGYALKGNEIYKTVDGGIIWNSIPTGFPSDFQINVQINKIYFLNQDTGFISLSEANSFAYPNSIFFTVDGGGTWSRLLGPFDGSQLDFYIADQNDWYFHMSTNWLNAPSDTIYHTMDAGLTWNKIGNATTVQYNQLINNLIIYSDSTTANQTHHLFYKSINGGATSTLLLTDSTVASSFVDHQFLNSNVGYVLLFQYNFTDNIPSKIYKTVDGGQNWISYTIPAACSAPVKMHFTDVNTGYIISNNTNQCGLYKTTDGGQTWNLDYSEDTNEYFVENIWEYFGSLYVLGNNIISNKITTANNCNNFCVKSIAMDTVPGQLSVTMYGDTTGQSFTNYPYVNVIDGNGDTLAKGYLNSFGTFGDTFVLPAKTQLISIPANFTVKVHFTFLENGNFITCIYDYPMNCTVGINKIAVPNNVLTVFPNPASTSINISLGDLNNQLAIIKLYDNSGRLVKAITTLSDELRFEREGLCSGIYFITANIGKKYLTAKLIIE